MKPKKINLICTFVLMLAAAKSYSQFTPSVIGDNYSGVTVVPYNTSNDLLQFGSDTFRVSVYTDTSCNSYHGIAWNVDYNGNNYQGNAMYNQCDTILHVDVCLVDDGTDVYALVASFIGGQYNLFCLNMFLWDPNGGSGAAFYLDPNHYLRSGTFGTTINIDGNYDTYHNNNRGQFAFVYDDNTPYSYIVTGYCSTQVVTMYNSGTPIQVQCSTATALSPDISIYTDNNYDRVYITYIDGAGRLVVEDYNMDDLIAGQCTTATGSPFGQLLQRGVPTGQLQCGGCIYSSPRIATPNSSVNTIGKYTVVTEVADHSSNFFIVGYNDNNVGSPIVYNNRSVGNGPANLEMVNNFGPVVAYDSNYPSDGIWVGWNIDNLSTTYNGYSNYVQALYPVVIQCDANAIPLVSATYWEVPYCSTLVANDAVQFLSLSGRYATDVLWATYYNANSSGDICTKEITPSTASSFRMPDETFALQFFSEFINKNLDAGFTFKIYNLQGNLVVNEKAKGRGIIDACKKQVENLSASVFIVHIISDDGKYSCSDKIFLHK